MTTVDGRLEANIADFARDRTLMYLVGAFAFLLVVVGGFKGLKSLISLGITTAAIFFWLLPMLLQGHSPMALTILVCTVISFLTFVIVSGLNMKTVSAIVGTVGGVFVAGALAIAMGYAAKLTGFNDEEMQLLMHLPETMNLDFKGLLFSGMSWGLWPTP